MSNQHVDHPTTTQYPNVSVKLILRSQNKIFMMRHTNGAYDFPGGRMEWGESPEATLHRELLEELDYTPPAEPQFFGIWNYIAPDNSRHSVFLYYFLDVPEPPQFTMLESADPLWLNKDYFLENWPDDHDRVERMFSVSPVKATEEAL